MKRQLILISLFALAVAACSSTGPTPLAIVASSGGTIGIGEQRVLFGLIDPETNEFLADEGRSATALLRNEDGTPLGEYELDFVWTVPDVRGIYAAYFDLPEAGIYQVTIQADGLSESGPTGFLAIEDPTVASTGLPAPKSVTRTIADYPDLAVISSDPDPDPALYELSVDEAVSNGTPSVIVFATPAFCSSAACGPMLDQVKQIKGDFPDIDFVHVEIYEDIQVQDIADLVSVEAVVEWSLPSEPWIFVVDADGVIVSGFEGAVTDDELVAVLDGLDG